MPVGFRHERDRARLRRERLETPLSGRHENRVEQHRAGGEETRIDSDIVTNFLLIC